MPSVSVRCSERGVFLARRTGFSTGLSAISESAVHGINENSHKRKYIYARNIIGTELN